MENKIGQFEFVDCSTVDDEFSVEVVDSSAQTIVMPPHIISSQQLIPFVTTEPSKQPIVNTELVYQPVVKTEPVELPVVNTELVYQPVVKTEPVELQVVNTELVYQPVVNTELIYQPVLKTEPFELPVVNTGLVYQPVVDYQQVVKTEPVEQPVDKSLRIVKPINSNQDVAVSSSNVTAVELKTLQILMQKRSLAAKKLNNRRANVIKRVEGETIREWREPVTSSSTDCRHLLKEQYIICKKLVLDDTQHVFSNTLSDSSSSLSSQTSNSGSQDPKVILKYRKKRELNNQSSKRSREKRKNELRRLQIELEELSLRNEELREQLKRLAKCMKKFSLVVLRCEQIKNLKGQIFMSPSS